MFKVIYLVYKDEAADEIEWLKEQKIFPALADAWDWKKELPMVRIGVIVDEGALLTLKLRTNKIEHQEKYRQRK